MRRHLSSPQCTNSVQRSCNERKHGAERSWSQAVLTQGSVVNDVLSGNSRIALAITEPEAGSDVRGLKTEAVLSNDGASLIINGQKKVSSHAIPAMHSVSKSC